MRSEQKDQEDQEGAGGERQRKPMASCDPSSYFLIF
jgi:hypothetical protein